MSQFLRVAVKLVLVAFVLLGLNSCLFESKGDHILIVEVVSGDDDSSEIGVVQQALTKGGLIFINVDIARALDANFDQEYTATDSEGRFMIAPALLNFVGGQGWNFKAIGGGLGSAQRFYFTKSR